MIRFGVEILVFLLWIGSATLMLRHKGGCEVRPPDHIDLCFGPEGGEPHGKFTDHPVISWDIAIAFSFIEM